jgi:hyperosmotically inducible periplasmic protein
MGADVNRGIEVLATAIVVALLFGGTGLAVSPGSDEMGKDDAATQQPADNSGRNVRDRAGTAPTADQQSNNAGDMKVTQSVRRAVVADKSLSTNAHNVKIITHDGVVTLRGPVKNEGEKGKIEVKTRAVPGVKRVDNQLEIAS